NNPYIKRLTKPVQLVNHSDSVVFISDNDKEEGKEVTGGGGLSDKVSLYKGDITVLEVDAIVNAGKDTAWGPHGCKVVIGCPLVLRLRKCSFFI
uniref:Mono-ADP ribosylhydrolase 2 n=1 Tax=Sphaeramia orbicularis TaxID=375764 RepID=A0A673BS35_9TELE